MDSKGRIFVADLGNSRIQIFDQDGKYLEQWTQFGRPSGIYIDDQDTIYVADNTSDGHESKRGIRIGSAKDGSVKAFIPDVEPQRQRGDGPESIVADANGTVYACEPTRKKLTKYALQ